MAFTPYSGLSGRVIVGSTNVAGIDKWSLDKTVETVPTTNFESTADSNGIIWETLVASIGSASGSCEGTFDGDTTNSEDLFPIGTQVVLDLLFAKTGPVGYIDLPAIVTGISPGQDLRGKGTFKMSFKCNGAPSVV